MDRIANTLDPINSNSFHKIEYILLYSEGTYFEGPDLLDEII